MEKFNLAAAMAWRVPDNTTGIKAVFLGDKVEEFELNDLLRGQADALGKGAFGTTYKVKLKNQENVVVKRLWTNNKIAEKDLKEKIEELGKIVHQNLLPIRAYSCIIAERVLVYDYMPMGSLAFLLHETKDGSTKSALTWEVRCSIAYGVASALQHIHTLGSNICHGNIRSSNVFLSENHPNNNSVHLSEYSLWLLESQRSKLKLPEGYRAPEVITLHDVSHKSDVYSFGVLLLELLTRKPPLGAIRAVLAGSVDLAKWVRAMFIEKPIIEVFDEVLARDYENINGEEMVDMLQLAICCTFEIPSRRPSMDAVTKRIQHISRCT